VAALIEEQTGHTVTLEPGSKGIFDVAVNERVVASKTAEGFPSEQAIIERVVAELSNSET